jgi:hypothetical protein
MINECGALGGMRTGRENWSTRRKPTAMPICPSQTAQDLTLDGNGATGEGSRFLLPYEAFSMSTLHSVD